VQEQSDLEWVVDDLVCLFLFVGNDFIPPLPSISIRNNSLHTLFDFYKTLPREASAFHQNGRLDVRKLKTVFQHLALSEYLTIEHIGTAPGHLHESDVD